MHPKLIPALRQFRGNDTDSFVSGYDMAIIDREFAILEAETELRVIAECAALCERFAKREMSASECASAVRFLKVSAPAPSEPAPQGVPEVIYVPVAVHASDFAQGWHPKDTTPKDAACQVELDKRGDDSGQGLNPYWKWGFRAGWQAAAPAPAVTSGGEAEPFGYVLQNDWRNDQWSLFKGGTKEQAARMRQTYPKVHMVYLAPQSLPAASDASVRDAALGDAISAIAGLARRYTTDYSTAVNDAVDAIRALISKETM